MRFDAAAQAYIQLLIEGRIDDLKTGNPHLVNEIDAYSNQDPTPQKKFVPWLVSQHKKGNVTPTDPELHQTLTGFETYKSRHGIKDHSSKSFQEIKAAVAPHLGTAATNKDLVSQQIREGIDHIFSSDDGNIHAFHVKTKEASQHVYGGGKELGGLHTGWCVSARSKDCLFGSYGTMYTVHVKHDPKSPYAVHPDSDTITTRDNNPDEYSFVDGMKKFPHLKPAISAIKKVDNKFKAIKEKETQKTIKHLTSTTVSSEDLMSGIKHEDYRVREAVANHEKASPDILKMALVDNHPNVKIAAINNNNITSDLFSDAVGGKFSNSLIKHALVSKSIKPEFITDVLKSDSPFISTDSKISLLDSDRSTMDHLNIAIDHKNSNISGAVAGHKLATDEHIAKLLSRLGTQTAAMNSGKVKSHHIESIFNNTQEDPYVHGMIKESILQSPNLNSDHINSILNTGDVKSKIKAINHKSASPDNISKVLDNEDEDEDVKIAALRNPNISLSQLQRASSGKDVFIKHIAKQEMSKRK